MVRPVVLAVSATVLLAGVAQSSAQPGCQPTIMKPCAQPAPKPDNAGKPNQAQDAPRRGIPVAPDTTFGLGARGLGLNGKF
ncbi:MAG: hypothetical protein WAL48_19545 [Xanthobacteraceae bacterium]